MTPFSPFYPRTDLKLMPGLTTSSELLRVQLGTNQTSWICQSNEKASVLFRVWFD